MIYLYGAGKRGLIVSDLLKQNNNKQKVKFIDNKKIKKRNIYNEDYFIKNFNYKKDYLIITITDPQKKKEIYSRLKKYCKLRLYKPLISKTATIKKNVKISKGTVIMDNSYIGQDVSIMENSAVGISSLVSHDCKIGCNSEISHKSKLAGNVKVGDNTYIGMGAIVVQNIKILKNCFIGAGVLVKRNMQANKKITLKQKTKLR